jgi:hypothetical protein
MRIKLTGEFAASLPSFCYRLCKKVQRRFCLWGHASCVISWENVKIQGKFLGAWLPIVLKRNRGKVVYSSSHFGFFKLLVSFYRFLSKNKMNLFQHRFIVTGVNPEGRKYKLIDRIECKSCEEKIPPFTLLVFDYPAGKMKVNTVFQMTVRDEEELCRNEGAVFHGQIFRVKDGHVTFSFAGWLMDLKSTDHKLQKDTTVQVCFSFET